MSFLTTFHAQRGFYPVSLLRRRLEIGSNIRTAGTASGHAQGTCRAANSCARLSPSIASASSARIKKGLRILQSPFADQNPSELHEQPSASKTKQSEKTDPQ